MASASDSNNNSPVTGAGVVPVYLDFNDLRNEGITHLGNLTGKIWTDYNVHDPGITILEALCYALQDLDYRIKLPAGDLFARKPGDDGPDNNFYSPAQILACNPVTVTDYRKLLVDIDGVRNAWLEPAADLTDPCLPEERQHARVNDSTKANQSFLNGLYHVYIEMEKDAVRKTVCTDIRRVFSAHRNLCEDISDITMLGALPLGVCAIVELTTDADVTQVYLDIMQKLQDFLSPSPKFYTLQELLDRDKPIDTIFAGRPYNTTISHGFVDSEELEAIQLKKELHLSDLYAALFAVSGVKTIRDLQWKTCAANTSAVETSGCGRTAGGDASGENAGTSAIRLSREWKFPVPIDHVIQFSAGCCGIRFLRAGKSVPFDPSAYEAILAASSAKNLYTSSLPNLDLAFPGGTYREDLADYYSIQNDFPNTYGIAKGGIPADAPVSRKAAALQLKGFLLFFDQLLADYLGQLFNMRYLFAMGAGTGKTYFLNDLTNGLDPDKPNYVPDVDKLWRYAVDQPLGDLLGAAGSTLVIPVSRKALLEPPAGSASARLPTDLSVLDFGGWDDLQDVIIRLKAVFGESPSPSFHPAPNTTCYYYYIDTPLPDMVLVPKKTFSSQDDAARHAAYVLSAGMLDESYSLFSISGDRYTFTLDYSAATVSDILQTKLEEPTLYLKRRQYFLDHLMSRFAERFTDYALLRFGPSRPLQKAEDHIRAEENYLSQYAVLSSGRGQAADYRAPGSYSGKQSGLERKWMALVGASPNGPGSLCNFIVQQSGSTYMYSIVIGGKTFFAPEEVFDSEASARQEAGSLLNAMADRSRYSVEQISPLSYAIVVHGKGTAMGDAGAAAGTAGVMMKDRYASEEDALTVSDRLAAIIAHQASRQDVFVSGYMFKPRLVDSAGKPGMLFTAFFSSVEEAMSAAAGSLKDNQAPGPDQWKPAVDGARSPGALYRISSGPGTQFFDVDAFRISIDNTIIDKPDAYTFEVLNSQNSFSFRATDEFGSEEEARTRALELLLLLTDPTNYLVEKDAATGRQSISITGQGRRLAIFLTDQSEEKETERLAKKIQDLVRKQVYSLAAPKEAYRWKFSYYLGYEKESRQRFDSVAEYDDAAVAQAAARSFAEQAAGMRLQQDGNGWMLATDVAELPVLLLQPGTGEPPAENVLALLLQQQQAIGRAAAPDSADEYTKVEMDALSQQGQFTYQLVSDEPPLAYGTNVYSDRVSAEAERTKLTASLKKGVKYLEICLDGKIIRKRKDPITGKPGYHYMVKCHNTYYASGKAMTLLESVRGYISEEEARQAFADNYLYILETASRESSYETLISLAELVSNDPPAGPFLFVPKETKVSLGGADDEVIRKMVLLAGSYPIRRTECPSTTAECGATPVYAYYCGLSIPDVSVTGGNVFEWRCSSLRKTIAEAQQDFSALVRLFGFPGNLFVEKDDDAPTSSYRIYLREVLAESAGRFATEAAAWGEDGVEKLICAVSEPGAILSYQRNCNNSFLINCGQPLLLHPCTYPSPKMRDAARDALLQRFRERNERAFAAHREGDQLVLTGEDGISFAKAPAGGDERPDCCLVADIIGAINNSESLFVQKDGFSELTNKDGSILFLRSYTEGVVLNDWKALVLLYACRYPVVSTTDGRWSVEISLPGFSVCGGSEPLSGCDDPAMEPEPACYIAWKSSCLFNTCEDAQAALEEGIRLLADEDRYLSVFTPDCHSFGISLSDPKDIVAIHPQSYVLRETVNHAIQRTREAVNAEGLRLVEHILLRPRPDRGEDCGCRSLYCQGQPDCGFHWEVDAEDPCLPVSNISFIPGNDPYSFIATVVLPAWPDKFRLPDNRVVLENSLHREAPAHVMLRVLWLRPRDYCQFEGLHETWVRSMTAAANDNGQDSANGGADRIGNQEQAACDLITFLFHTAFTDMEECQSCRPCPDAPGITDPCAGGLTRSRASQLPDFSGQVNRLYCWAGNDQT